MNETDKTLLERAAKAIGLSILVSGEYGLRIASDGCRSGYLWNPLESLSDAAELALLRSINVVFLPDRVYAGLTVFETYTDPASKHLAYCRAVTRAAASAAMYNGK